ncbi:MAG: hypothetical protein EA424_17915 [Planctomycetaceae bacterium]|nr:MAG: hypothetical protein EA424_17915 [Planctomycetaceae bacterium]
MFDLLDRRRTTGTQSVGEALSEKGSDPLEGTLKLAKYGVPGEDQTLFLTEPRARARLLGSMVDCADQEGIAEFAVR